MKEIVELIQAIAPLIQAMASLLWPILTFILIWRFRKEITDLIRRLKRGKLLGQELELADSLDKLGKSALAAASEVPASPVIGEQKSQEQKALELSSIQRNEINEVQALLEKAEVSPKLALLSLANDIERELREILFSQGEVNKPFTFTMASAIKLLENRDMLATHVLIALRNFQEVRNQIVHGRGEIVSDDVLRAIDSGSVVLKTLQSISRGIHIVYHPSVEIYSDRECIHPRPDARGVILETTNTANNTKAFNYISHYSYSF